MQVDRAKVIHAIKDYTDALGSKPQAEALAEACEKSGISVDAYNEALRADPSLADLEKQSTTGAVVESADPGPYDAISRESPSGQPGDLTKPRSLPRSEAPGGS